MNQFIFIIVLIMSSSASASLKVIYGEDNRMDVFEVRNPLYLRLARSTAAMVEKKRLQKSGQGINLSFYRTLETSLNVCPSERFSEQPTGPICSGFLIGEDTLVTAGHCFQMLGPMGYPTPEAVCRGFSWVFNYALDSSNRNPTEGFLDSDVYHCQQVITSQMTQQLDLAVIRLDRKVTGRSPLSFRKSGKVSSQAQLVVIGHPSGLPTKIAPGARVLSNHGLTTFEANLDTFQGNSGSAVFDATTGVIEGILVQGKTDYRPSIPGNPQSCMVVNRCQDDGQRCEFESGREPRGEVVTRITEILKFMR